MNTFVLLAQAAEGPVQDVARTFGVDWIHLAAQTISFSIVCALLYRYAYHPVLEMLEQRKKIIAQGLADAERSKAELAETEAQRRTVIAQANARVRQLIEQAHTAAARVQERETQKAIAEAQALLAAAREAADREHARMLAELKHELGQLVLQTTEKVTGKILTPEDQQRLAQEAAVQVDTSS